MSYVDEFPRPTTEIELWSFFDGFSREQGTMGATGTCCSPQTTLNNSQRTNGLGYQASPQASFGGGNSCPTGPHQALCTTSAARLLVSSFNEGIGSRTPGGATSVYIVENHSYINFVTS